MNHLTHLRRTKIVVTLGPSLDDYDTLKRVMLAGADVFRANFSHGTHETHENRITMVRKDCAKNSIKSLPFLLICKALKFASGVLKIKKSAFERRSIFYFRYRTRRR